MKTDFSDTNPKGSPKDTSVVESMHTFMGAWYFEEYFEKYSEVIFSDICNADFRCPAAMAEWNLCDPKCGSMPWNCWQGAFLKLLSITCIDVS